MATHATAIRSCKLSISVFPFARFVPLLLMLLTPLISQLAKIQRDLRALDKAAVCRRCLSGQGIRITTKMKIRCCCRWRRRSQRFTATRKSLASTDRKSSSRCVSLSFPVRSTSYQGLNCVDDNSSVQRTGAEEEQRGVPGLPAPGKLCYLLACVLCAVLIELSRD